MSLESTIPSSYERLPSKPSETWEGWIKVSDVSKKSVDIEKQDGYKITDIKHTKLNEIRLQRKKFLKEGLHLETQSLPDKKVSTPEVIEINDSNRTTEVQPPIKKRRLVRQVESNEDELSSDLCDDIQLSDSASKEDLDQKGNFNENETTSKSKSSAEIDDDTEFDNVLKQCQKYSNHLNNLLQKRVPRKTSKAPEMELQPKTLLNRLKEYQLVGLNWLYLLHLEGLSGILADEMGLGKTVQTISLLTLLKEKGNNNPHMIVVPASTINNWKRELKNWSSSLEVMFYYGTQAERSELRNNILKHNYRCQADLETQQYPFDVLLTTFRTATGKVDRPFLKRICFEYLVVDEAQMLKGKDTSRYVALSKFNSKRRLLLTGTPLQNNLDELASLLQFLMPDFFSNLKSSKMAKEIRELLKKRRNITESEYAMKMKHILEPFILRRLKSEVGIELTPKLHKIVHIKMPPIQRQVYDDIFRSTQKFVDEKGTKELESEFDNFKIQSENQKNDDNEISDNDRKEKKKDSKKGGQLFSIISREKSVSTSGFMNNMLMQMRKVSNHPTFVRSFYSDEDLLDLARDAMVSDAQFSKLSLEEILNDFSFLSDLQLHNRAMSKSSLKYLQLSYDQLFRSSGKMLALAKLLPELKQQGHRVTIFSQFTTVLDLLELFLTDDLHMKYLRLDGSTSVSERQDLIDAFNTQTDYFIFLLTTQAGGLGINLTSADTVIFHDISYNPQVDRQAEDRCHRLGQDKQVTIYRLLTVGTVEDHMYNMAKAKTELNDLMLNEGKFANSAEQEISQNVTILKNLARRMFVEKTKLPQEIRDWTERDEVEMYITDTESF